MLIAVWDDPAYGAEVHHFGPMGHAVDLTQFADADLAAMARAAGAEGVVVRQLDDLVAVERVARAARRAAAGRRQGRSHHRRGVARGGLPRALTTSEEARMSDALAALSSALAGGAVEVVDLTQPLSESTPVIQLPPPFANTPGLTVHSISDFDENGPGLGLELAGARRARRHPLRRAVPLDQRPGRARPRPRCRPSTSSGRRW